MLRVQIDWPAHHGLPFEVAAGAALEDESGRHRIAYDHVTRRVRPQVLDDHFVGDVLASLDCGRPQLLDRDIGLGAENLRLNMRLVVTDVWLSRYGAYGSGVLHR